MFRWQPQMIRFMQDVSENSRYHAALADRISNYLPEAADVCDAGCGLGYLSIELSKRCRRITAVDIAPQALDVLRCNIERFHRTNIRVMEGDIAQCPPEEPYDAMVFCFFGSTAEALKIVKAQCSGRAIIIKKNWEAHRFTLGYKPLARYTFAQTQAEFRSMGIRFTSETFSLEMGQPFRTITDAVEFFRMYSQDEAPQEITEEQVMDKLVRQTSEEFPYYLPSLNHLGIIVLDAGDIPR